MKLLVTTEFGFFILDRYNIHLIRQGACYGLTWNESEIFVFQRGHPKHRTLIWCFNKQLQHVRDISAFSVARVHQAWYDPPTDRVYITNTDYNRIEIWDQTTGDFGSFNYTGTEKNLNHLNTIYRHGNFLYICEHNGKREYKTRIKKINENFEVVDSYEIGNEGHDIYIENNLLYSCMSLDRTLVIYDMDTHNIIEEKEFHLPYRNFRDYPRGLAVGKDYMVIGHSCWGTPLERKDDRAGYITIINKKSLEIVDTIRLPRVNQIFSIRLMSELDQAHNGIPFGVCK
jgi:hypothetical protein